MRSETVGTYWVRIYLSGPLEVIKQECRRECLREGLCVTVYPTTFIYTGGEETGAVVGLVNYPRFPSDPQDLEKRGRELALRLLDATFQHSVLVMTPTTTEWYSRRDAGLAPE